MRVGELISYNRKKEVGIIETLNDERFYCYGKFKRGHCYKFDINPRDDEIAVNLREITMPFRITRYSVAETILSLLIALILGAIMAIFMVRAVHAEDFSSEDITLMAKIVSAEAGNQPFQGKKLVASVILNRVDSDKFPNSVKEVVYQEKQFAVIKNGSFDKTIAIEEDYEAVLQETKHRSNNNILYFTAGGYGKSGKPAFSVGNHYFSK